MENEKQVTSKMDIVGFRYNDFIVETYTDRKGIERQSLKLKWELSTDENLVEEFKEMGVYVAPLKDDDVE